MGPWDGDIIAAPEGLSVNDASLSLKLSFDGRSVFFAGDLEGPGELELSERAALGLGDPHSDILKVPHHGSRTSSSQALLNVVKPQIALISAGRGNRFGFPHGEVVDRYQGRKVEVLRTDRDGAVQLQWSQNRGISATCWRPSAGLCAGF
jgi:competence protein ComEC